MRAAPIVLLLVLVACFPPRVDEPGPCKGPCDEGLRCDEVRRACVLDLAGRCTAGSSWSPGTLAFREVGSEWGLSGADGVRLSVTDLEGDGWPDLFVRRAGSRRDDLVEGVRASWLLRNTGARGFEDVTLDSGILANRGTDATLGRPVEVTVFADVDGDGDLDAFTGVSGGEPGAETSEIVLNDGAGRFVLGPEKSDLRVARGLVGAASFTDLNRDGLVDLFVGYGGGAPAQDRLYVGVGGGEFVEATGLHGLTTSDWTDPGILDAGQGHTISWGTAACDLDGDGLPELLSASYGRSPNHLWVAAVGPGGAITYENRSVASGYAYDHRTDWSDNESARCWCKLHPGDEGCAGVPAPTSTRCASDADAFRWSHDQDRDLWRLGGNSGTTVCADVNGDGLLDLLTTELVHWDVGGSSDPSELLLNAGGSPLRFERPGNEATGLTRPRAGGWNDGDMTAAVFDFDNDGRPDVYIGSSDYPGTRGWLWHQTPEGTFQAVPFAEGIDHLSSNGVAVADFDRDGDLDVALGHSRARCSDGDHCYPDGRVRLFENALGQDGNWLALRLEGGPGSNRAAIGARVTVRTATRLQVQEVGGGHGHYGLQQDLVLHFGLGAECEAEVEVRWPDAEGTTESQVLPARYRYTWKQGERPTPVE